MAPKQRKKLQNLHNPEVYFIKNSAIKGYHIFIKITLLKEMTMISEREEENEFDPYTMVSN